MEGPKFVGTSPSDLRWAGDGSKLFFRWKAPEDQDDETSVYEISRSGGTPRRLSDEEARRIPPAFGRWDQERRHMLAAEDGDIVLADTVSGERRKLTRTFEQESDPHFNRDYSKVYFTRNNNLFVLSLAAGEIFQATDIRAPTPGPARGGSESDGATSPNRKWLEDQQKELFDVIRERSEREEKNKKRSEKLRQPVKAFTLGAQQTVSKLRLTPDEQYVTFTLSERATGARSTIVPNYVTRTGFTEDLSSRTKVGETPSKSRLAIWKIGSGEITYADHGQADRAASMSTPVWSEDGQNAFIVARAEDHKDRWILLLDVTTGKTRALDQLHDDAWLGGPGASTAGWMPNQREIYFVSEKSGYAHLYVKPIDGGQERALTSGNFEIYEPQISRDKASWYLTTNEVHPGERHFYKMPLEGGDRVRLTLNAGNNQVELSPEESTLATLHSYANKPPELYLAENQPQAPARQITQSTRFEFRSYPWKVPEFVTFNARDGATVHARLYKPDPIPQPRSFFGRRKPVLYPAILFVHGAGYLQNAHKWWSSYYREYMFHHILNENGYVVLDIDYRGSAGYGRDWRTGIYRHMGGKDLTDQIDGARWLVENHSVDPKRVGIYGGSYGGFITLMAMFTQPDVFAAGAALRPVSDWAHYNAPYTSNILNLPHTDVEAYKKSSPIYFAQGLRGALLICHGMADVNVHFQDTVRLAQRLVELRKENWQVAIYPVEDHAFQQSTSWADEYKRILRLFEENLKNSRQPPVASRQ